MENLYAIIEITITFIEGFTYLLFAYSLFSGNLTFKQLAGKLILGSLIFTVIMNACNQIALVQSWTSYVFIVIMALVVYIVMKPKFIYCISAAAVYILFQVVIEMLSVCLISISTNNPDYIFKILGESVSRVIYIVAMKGIMLFIYFAIKEKLENINIKLLSNPILIIADFVGLVFMLRVLNFLSINNTYELKICISLLFVVFIITFVATIYLTERLIKETIKKEENAYLELKNDLLEDNLKNLNRLYEGNSKSFHEFKHHINAIERLLQNNQYERAKAYINDISMENSYIHEYMTGNEIVDIILNVKNAELKGKGITLKSFINIPREIAIKDKDLCSLLLNLIDNAAEAAAKEPQKNIIMDMKLQKHILYITVKNNSSLNPIQNKFETAKKGIHGFGMKIVYDIVEKYDGFVKYDYSENIFKISVMLCEKV